MARTYRAITVGVPGNQTISTLHGRHPRSRLRFSSFVREGRQAITHVTVVEVLAGGKAALVECRLETGRTHQIRVHLSERAHCPVLGDALYGGMAANTPLGPVSATLGRHALHAVVLGFRHPVSGDWHQFESPLPSSLCGAVSMLRDL
jgi:23S rRNA pseudouridine1911/1915/1917 synthase